MIRLAAKTPIYCAACFNQQPELRHVDFDAAADRGYGNDEAGRVVMDDLVICENCVKEAAIAVGMTDDADLKREASDLKVRCEALDQRAQKAERYADRLEDAFEHRAQPIEVDHRRKPRQRSAIA